jgi:hypothetical protein
MRNPDDKPWGARTEKWIEKAKGYEQFWLEEVARRGWIKKFEDEVGIEIGDMFSCGAFGCAFMIEAPVTTFSRSLQTRQRDQTKPRSAWSSTRH